MPFGASVPSLPCSMDLRVFCVGTMVNPISPRLLSRRMSQNPEQPSCRYVGVGTEAPELLLLRPGMGGGGSPSRDETSRTETAEDRVSILAIFRGPPTHKRTLQTGHAGGAPLTEPPPT